LNPGQESVQSGGKIGVIQDPFGRNGAPKYLGATTPINGGAISGLSMTRNGLLQAEVLIEEDKEVKGQTTSEIKKSLFVWNAAALVQAAVDFTGPLTRPIDRVDGNPRNPQIDALAPRRFDHVAGEIPFKWMYGIANFWGFGDVVNLSAISPPPVSGIDPWSWEALLAEGIDITEETAKTYLDGAKDVAGVFKTFAERELLNGWYLVNQSAAALLSAVNMDNSAQREAMQRVQDELNELKYDTSSPSAKVATFFLSQAEAVSTAAFGQVNSSIQAAVALTVFMGNAAGQTAGMVISGELPKVNPEVVVQKDPKLQKLIAMKQMYDSGESWQSVLEATEAEFTTGSGMGGGIVPEDMLMSAAKDADFGGLMSAMIDSMVSDRMTALGVGKYYEAYKIYRESDSILEAVASVAEAGNRKKKPE